MTPANDNDPIFTSADNANVPENTTAVIDVDAIDVDLPAQTVIYSILAGGDGALFSIVQATGVLTFIAAPDYENTGDIGADNERVISSMPSGAAPP